MLSGASPRGGTSHFCQRMFLTSLQILRVFTGKMSKAVRDQPCLEFDTPVCKNTNNEANVCFSGIQKLKVFDFEGEGLRP